MDLLWTLYSCCAIICVLYASKLRRFLAIWGYLMPYMDLFDAICVIWWYLICSANIYMQNDLKCRDKIKINEQLKTGAQLWLFDAIYWSIWVHVALTCASWQCYGLTIIVFAECRHTTKCLPCGLPGTLFCRESRYTHGKHICRAQLAGHTQTLSTRQTHLTLSAIVLATMWVSPCTCTQQSLCRVVGRLCRVSYTHGS
jgi:hypothetical protein